MLGDISSSSVILVALWHSRGLLAHGFIGRGSSVRDVDHRVIKHCTSSSLLVLLFILLGKIDLLVETILLLGGLQP